MECWLIAAILENLFYLPCQWRIQDFPEVVLQPLRGEPAYYLTIFSRKLHEILVRGVCPSPPLDPPLHETMKSRNPFQYISIVYFDINNTNKFLKQISVVLFFLDHQRKLNPTPPPPTGYFNTKRTNNA